jgi:hypothetical protein
LPYEHEKSGSEPYAGICFYIDCRKIPSFTESFVYKGPFQIKKGQTIIAIAKKTGVNNSSISRYASQ